MNREQKMKALTPAMSLINSAIANVGEFASAVDDAMSLTLDDQQRAALSPLIDEARTKKRELYALEEKLRQFAIS